MTAATATRAASGVRWSGHWIAPEPRAAPADRLGLGVAEPCGFSRSLFRRTFELATVPAEVPSRLTADSRYVLWVNGREVGRGPARSQPGRQRYDSFDLAPYLVAGPNVVAILVTYYGRANSFWMPPPGGGVGGDAALVFEARAGDVELVSDGEWRAHRSTAWTEPSDGGGALHRVPVEILDARELPAGWQEPGFDDSGWSRAAVVTTTHVGGLARSQPPTFPFGRLQPRGISQLGGDRVASARILDSSSRPAPVWEDTADHPVTRVTQVLLEPATAAGPAELPATFEVGPGRVHHVGVDFGRVVAGFVELEIEAPEGTVVELQYREREFRPELVGAVIAPETGARYITPGGPSTFAAVELNGLRYAHLAVHAEREATVTIRGLVVREHLYPRTGGAYFRSDDPSLDALYRAGIRTVDLNSFDAFTDCPTREQRAWVGDGVVHQMVQLATNEDWGLAGNYVELGDSPRPDGMLPMSVAGDLEAGGLTIPDWALHWVHGVHVLYRHQGDLERVRRHLPTVERVLRWYADYVDDRGTISDVPEWSLVDWASVLLTGRSSILTALWARALDEFAELSEEAGNPGAAAWARGLYATAARGFEDFWDADRGLYVDHIEDGTRMPAASQAASASAIVSGLAPRERWGGIVDTITDPGRLVVRSWIGGEHGGYDEQKMVDQAQGIQRIDWDADREIVIAQPFFSYVVHDAVARAGRAERLVDLVARWEQFLVDGYDTLGECWGWGTPVHGWSATPTRDLVSYVLGITPDRPGFARVRVAPRPGRLREVAGAVPTPHGLVEVRVSGPSAEIDSPVPVLVVREDGTEVELAPGMHRVTVRTATP